MKSLSLKEEQSWLSWFLRGILLLGTFVLVARLFELQVIKGDYYRGLSDGNRVRKITIGAPRGRIMARGGEVLVGNKDVYKKLVLTGDGGYQKVEVGTDFPEAIVESKRFYPLGGGAAHVTGYVGEVTSDELGKVEPGCSDKGPFVAGGWTGRSGLEQTSNCRLRGTDGEELIEVDTFGNKVRLLGRKPARRGADITTTIDYGLQKKAAGLLTDSIGSIIATDIHGQVLALYSSPSYDPNLFADPKKENETRLEGILRDQSFPLFNRVVGGLYHPGSTFKIVTSIAALEEGKIDKDYIYEDTGAIVVNNFEYTNWYFTQYGAVEGKIGLTRAIARSTDTFFYKIGEAVGVDKLAEWARKFGLGSKSGIDLEGEVQGLVPDPKWKLEVKGERWFLGNTYHMSIGQGDLAVTPLAVNQVTSVIATGGRLCAPYLVQDSRGENCTDMGIDRKNIDLVKQGLIQACQPGATAYPFFDYKPQVACKTGTAETSLLGMPHAWFTVFAPADDPEIIVTVLVENGGEGSSVAAPVAKELLEFYFGRK